jgi:hypothetical protein
MPNTIRRTQSTSSTTSAARPKRRRSLFTRLLPLGELDELAVSSPRVGHQSEPAQSLGTLQETEAVEPPLHRCR